jgi:hypothetical protein
MEKILSHVEKKCNSHKIISAKTSPIRGVLFIVLCLLLCFKMQRIAWCGYCSSSKCFLPIYMPVNIIAFCDITPSCILVHGWQLYGANGVLDVPGWRYITKIHFVSYSLAQKWLPRFQNKARSSRLLPNYTVSYSEDSLARLK